MGYTRLLPDQWEKPPWEFKIASLFDGRFFDFNKFGFSADLNNSTFVDIWSPGGNLSFLSSAEVMDINSSDAGDADGGVGARKLRIFGLDNDFKLVGEEITLLGLTIVPTVNSYIRVFRMVCTDVGSAESNVGIIKATAATAATLQSQIEIDLGQSAAAITTIPDGFFGLITSFQAGMAGGDSGIVDFQTREQGEAWRVRQRSTIPTGSDVTFDFTRFKSPIVVAPRSDVKMRAIKDGGGGSAGATGTFDYYLIDQREINTGLFEL